MTDFFCIMLFKSSHWLSYHDIKAIIPCPANMISVREMFWDVFVFIFISMFSYYCEVQIVLDFDVKYLHLESGIGS